MTTKEKRFCIVFSNNLNKYLEKREISQKELAKRLGVSTSAVSTWCRGEKVPRMDKVDKICDFLNIKRSNLIQENDQDEEQYYLNEETAQIAQEVYDNPELQILFKASRDLEPSDIKFVVDMIERMKGGKHSD